MRYYALHARIIPKSSRLASPAPAIVLVSACSCALTSNTRLRANPPGHKRLPTLKRHRMGQSGRHVELGDQIVRSAWADNPPPLLHFPRLFSSSGLTLLLLALSALVTLNDPKCNDCAALLVTSNCCPRCIGRRSPHVARTDATDERTTQTVNEALKEEIAQLHAFSQKTYTPEVSLSRLARGVFLALAVAGKTWGQAPAPPLRVAFAEPGQTSTPSIIRPCCAPRGSLCLWRFLAMIICEFCSNTR